MSTLNNVSQIINISLKYGEYNELPILICRNAAHVSAARKNQPFSGVLPPELRKYLASPAKSPSAPIREAAPPESGLSGKELITRLSFSHFVELLAVDEGLQGREAAEAGREIAGFGR